jgi:hypothetical protein
MSSRRTRASNASKHPGLATKPAPRRTSAQVKAAAMAKEATKVAKKQAKEARIKRVAEFESNARDNEDVIDATPRPNFAPRGRHPDSDAGLGTSEDDVSNPNKHTYIPPDRSGDESDNCIQSAEVMPIPKGKKKATLAGIAQKVGSTATEQLSTIAENSEGDSEPLRMKRGKTASARWGQPILEETDSDGAPPPFRNWKPTTRRRAAETEDSESDEVPPSKKPKVMEKAVERESMEKPGKKKQGIREAIAAVQRGQGVSQKQALVAAKDKVRVAVAEVKSLLTDAPSVSAMAPSGIDEGKGMRGEGKETTRKEIN